MVWMDALAQASALLGLQDLHDPAPGRAVDELLNSNELEHQLNTVGAR